MAGYRYPHFYYTTQEVATMLQVSDRTIQRMAQRKEIPATRAGRQWRFNKNSLEKLDQTVNKPKK